MDHRDGWSGTAGTIRGARRPNGCNMRSDRWPARPIAWLGFTIVGSCYVNASRTNRRVVFRCRSVAGDALLAGRDGSVHGCRRCGSVDVSAVSLALGDGSVSGDARRAARAFVSTGRRGPIVWHEKKVGWTQHSVAWPTQHDPLAALRGVHELPRLLSIYIRRHGCQNAHMPASCSRHARTILQPSYQ